MPNVRIHVIESGSHTDKLGYPGLTKPQKPDNTDPPTF
ncbi:hypothetical protein D3OALGA1CA_5738 [Olavius algarvensis associated proteobacterium Delta 3]|nr:hypothetical protein D3OALGB2SA_2436 [Olavius algarvensis associated proteobacterium Delta 3]CAB5171079.1 hypothetical protein D3OALGA1CA_5738 [Olavius algarvensis associated proteobacterium Delta 3]